MDRVDDFYNELLLGFAMPDRMFAHGEKFEEQVMPKKRFTWYDVV